MNKFKYLMIGALLGVTVIVVAHDSRFKQATQNVLDTIDDISFRVKALEKRVINNEK